MGTSEVNYLYDAQTVLRAPGSAAMTATGTVGTFALDKMVNAGKSIYRNNLGAQQYKIVIAVSAIDKTTGDETYTLTASTGAVGNSTVQVGELVVSSTGQYVLVLDARSIEQADANHAELKLTLTVAGTTPSITFAAWVV